MKKVESIIHHYPVEIQAILFILKNQLYLRRDSEIYFPFKINKERIIELCEGHRVTPFFYRFYAKYCHLTDDGLLQQLKTLTLNHTLKNLNLLNELNKLCNEFNQQNINYLVIKGPQLSHYLYGDASLRVCADLDFFVRDLSEMEKTSVILKEKGYIHTNFPEKGEWLVRSLYFKGKNECFFYNRNLKISIDLHIRPVANSIFSGDKYFKFFHDRIFYKMNGINISTPSIEKYFLFLCYHSAIHHYSKLHWLNDVWVFASTIQFDSDKLLLLAKEFKLTRSVRLTLTILTLLFEYPENKSYKLKRNLISNFLISTCLKSLSRKSNYGYTFRGRIRKTIYHFLLAENAIVKIDLILSVFFRYSYRFFVKN